jgi:hypothetical protein
MLTLERLRTEALSLPTLARLGLVILVIGGLADIAAHLEAVGRADHLHEHSTSELSAHVIGFVGMVLILLGVVLDGVRRSYRGRQGRRSIASTDARPTRGHEGRIGALPGGTRHG